MKIALCSSFVPFIYGGARHIIEWLQAKLMELGHQVELIYLPHMDTPDLLFQQMMSYRWIDLTASADRIICFRPPAHIIPHPNKILWLIHHIRIFYDLWDTPYRDFPDNTKYTGIRKKLHQADTAAIKEAQKIFTNSKVVSERLRHFNQVQSDVLYPPLFQPERFHCQDFNDEIVYISRIEHHKRQHLLIEALSYTRTPVKLRLCGTGNAHYTKQIKRQISQSKLNDRVIFHNQWISEAQKIHFLSHCLAAAYLPIDEDSYGYPSLEASHSNKPILTTTDSGGVLELVQDQYNGFIVPPEPKALAEAMDQFYLDREKTQTMGKNAQTQLEQLHIGWPHVLEKLLS